MNFVQKNRRASFRNASISLIGSSIIFLLIGMGLVMNPTFAIGEVKEVASLTKADLSQTTAEIRALLQESEGARKRDETAASYANMLRSAVAIKDGWIDASHLALLRSLENRLAVVQSELQKKPDTEQVSKMYSELYIMLSDLKKSEAAWKLSVGSKLDGIDSRLVALTNKVESLPSSESVSSVVQAAQNNVNIRIDSVITSLSEVKMKVEQLKLTLPPAGTAPKVVPPTVLQEGVPCPPIQGNWQTVPCPPSFRRGF